MKTIIKSILMILLMSGCKKEVTVDPLDNLYIYGTYTNYAGEKPTFTIDLTKTSAEIKTGTPTADLVNTLADGARVLIRIPNVMITSGEKNFSIDNISFEENKSSGWAAQSEFKDSSKSVKNKLAAVTVLDLSSSLGQDAANVKSSATTFTNNFLGPANGYLGLVLFSDTSLSYPFSTVASTVISRISAYTNYKNATQLYGAMNKGLDMLDTLSATVDSKVLITFTDGGDNNTNSPTAARTKILNSKYDRYIIGLRGKGPDYIESDLKALVSTSDKFIGADNINDVNAAFDKILSSITSTGSLQYYRTKQTFTRGVDGPIEVRCKIIVKR